MSIATIVIALIAAFIAWKVLAGMAKIAAFVLIAGVALYFLTQGGF